MYRHARETGTTTSRRILVVVDGDKNKLKSNMLLCFVCQLQLGVSKTCADHKRIPTRKCMAK